MLMGYCGKDISFSDKAMQIANFSLATSYSPKQADGSYKDVTEWHKVTCFNNLAKVAKDYLKKGSFIFIEGTLKTSKYVDKNQVERSVTRIIAKELRFLDKKADGSYSNGNSSSNSNEYDGPELQNESGAGSDEDFDCDIPF